MGGPGRRSCSPGGRDKAEGGGMGEPGRERQGGKENACVSGGWFMSRVCSSWQKKHNAVAFENDNEHLRKAADLKFLRRKQIQAAG